MQNNENIFTALKDFRNYYNHFNNASPTINLLKINDELGVNLTPDNN